jgi:protein TonB
MSAAAHRGDPWRRLPWVLPSAVLLSLLSLTGFWAIIVGKPYRPAPPQAVEVELVELPPAVAPPAPSPPPPTVAEPEPPPPPPPEPGAKPLPEPPPPRPQRVVRPVKPPPTAAPPPQTAVAPAPAAPPVSNAPPGGAIMGARAIYKPPLELPPELRRRPLEVVVVAHLRIAADGSVEAELSEPTADPVLNQWLIAWFRKYRFFPALRDGKPVASELDLRQPVVVK